MWRSMDENAARIDVETLLEHREFLRRLLRGLIGDASKVEDILQETWIAALDRTDLRRDGLRGWLVTVSRNFARKALRSDSRRRGRERAVARPEEQAPPTGDPVGQMTWHRRVVDEVLALPEPYRTAVLRRFLREETPADIAADLGIPAATVRTHVHRGLALLRQRLDGRADRRTWLAALVPLILPRPKTVSPGPALLATGVLLMTTKGKILTAAIVLALLLPLAGVSVFLATRPGDDESHTALVRTAAADSPSPEDPVVESDEEVVDRTPTPDVEPGVLVRGRVVDAEGRPIPGAEIGAATLEMGVLPRDEQKIVSDEKGEFEVRVKPGKVVQFEGRKEGFGLTRVIERSTPALAEEPVEIVLKAASRIHGVVLGPDGTPVAGARVYWIRVDTPGVSEPNGGGACDADGFWDHTDEKGRFEVKVSPPSIRKLRLIAHLEGFSAASVHLSGRRLWLPGHVTLVLGTVCPFEVRVLDAGTGLPITSARVVGYEHCRAIPSGEGRWKITGVAPGAMLTVQVYATGYATWRQKNVKATASPVTVRLVRRAVARLSGRVLSKQGTAVPFARVYAHEQGSTGRMHFSSAFSDAKGRFEFPDLERGSRYRIAADTDDLDRVAYPREVVTNGYGSLDLVLTRACRVRGRLASTKSGLVIGWGWLGVNRVCGLDDGEERVHIAGGPVFDTERGGLFTTGGWPEGIYDFTLHPRGHLPVEVRGVRLEKGRVTNLGEIVCERANGLTVVVRDPDGSPIEDCWVVVMGSPDESRISGRMEDDGGRIINRRLPDGDYRLLAFCDGRATSLIGSVSLTGQVDRRVACTLPAGGQLTIEVEDAAGEPVPGVALDVRAVAEPPLDRILVAVFRKDVWRSSRRNRTLPFWADLETVTDGDGRLSLGPLQPGPYVIRIGDERRTIDVRSGETTVVKLTR
jgi:RNA polymerase sigma factor (sigma-70 family)